MKRRIVSLLPAATEIVHALGATSALVGRSHECDFPPGIESRPALTAPTAPKTGTSAEIDQEVKASGAAGKSLYQIDSVQLRKLAPEVIITQGQCPVCAVSREDLDEVIQDWPGTPPEVVSLAPARFSDLWNDFATVAEAIGVEDRLPATLGPLKERVVSIIGTTGAMTKRPRVACIEWLEPLMLAGNWVPDLIQLAGGDPLGPPPGSHSGWVGWDKIVQSRPEVIVLTPCGFNLERTMAESARLRTLPGWKRLPAVQRGRVYAVDGSEFFNRPGPRLVDSLEIMAHLLYPSIFPAPSEGGRCFQALPR